MPKPEYDAATQQYKPVTPPETVALDTPPRADRTVNKPSRAAFPPGTEGLRQYQVALNDHAKVAGGGVDRGKEQRMALGGA